MINNNDNLRILYTFPYIREGAIISYKKLTRATYFFCNSLSQVILFSTHLDDLNKNTQSYLTIEIYEKENIFKISSLTLSFLTRKNSHFFRRECWSSIQKSLGKPRTTIQRYHLGTFMSIAMQNPVGSFIFVVFKNLIK